MIYNIYKFQKNQRTKKASPQVKNNGKFNADTRFAHLHKLKIKGILMRTLGLHNNTQVKNKGNFNADTRFAQ